MIASLSAKWRAFRAEFPRLRFDVLILLLVAGLILWLAASRPEVLTTNVLEVLFKFLLLSLPLIYWHVSRHSTWPYINLEQAIFADAPESRWKNVPPVVRAAVVFGVLVGYPIVIHGCLNW